MKNMLVNAYVLLLCQICLTNAKVHRGTLSTNLFNKNNWQYISKFIWGFGEGPFSVKARFVKPVQDQLSIYQELKIAVYLDEEWDSVLNLKLCDQKRSGARINVTLNIPFDGQWSAQQAGTISHVVRPHVWFFVFTDCDYEFQKLQKYYPRIEYEFIFKNTNQSHFSVDEDGFIMPLLIILIILGIFLFYNIKKMIESNKQNALFDWAFFILVFVIGCEFISILTQEYNLIKYSFDGIGSQFFNFTSQATSVLGQFLVTFLFILIAQGWTIKFMDIDQFDLFLPLAMALALLQIMIVAINQLIEDSHSKFHQYESFTGIIILLTRLGLLCYFVYSVYETYKTTKSDKLRSFMVSLTIVGVIYFLAFPVLFSISYLCPQYTRNRVITIGTLAMQVLGILSFTFLFTNKKGEYHTLSFRGRTLLPNDKID